MARSLYKAGAHKTGFAFDKLCGSKNYPYLPHWRDFSLDAPPPTPLEIPVKLYTFT